MTVARDEDGQEPMEALPVDDEALDAIPVEEETVEEAPIAQEADPILDLGAALRQGASAVPVEELSRKYRRVHVLDEARLRQLVAEAVDRALAGRAQGIREEERARLTEASRRELDTLISRHRDEMGRTQESERRAREEAEKARKSTVHEVKTLQQRYEEAKREAQDTAGKLAATQAAAETLQGEVEKLRESTKAAGEEAERVAAESAARLAEARAVAEALRSGEGKVRTALRAAEAERSLLREALDAGRASVESLATELSSARQARNETQILPPYGAGDPAQTIGRAAGAPPQDKPGTLAVAVRGAVRPAGKTGPAGAQAAATKGGTPGGETPATITAVDGATASGATASGVAAGALLAGAEGIRREVDALRLRLDQSEAERLAARDEVGTLAEGGRQRDAEAAALRGQAETAMRDLAAAREAVSQNSLRASALEAEAGRLRAARDGAETARKAAEAERDRFRKEVAEGTSQMQGLLVELAAGRAVAPVPGRAMKGGNPSGTGAAAAAVGVGAVAALTLSAGAQGVRKEAEELRRRLEEVGADRDSMEAEVESFAERMRQKESEVADLRAQAKVAGRELAAARELSSQHQARVVSLEASVREVLGPRAVAGPGGGPGEWEGALRRLTEERSAAGRERARLEAEQRVQSERLDKLEAELQAANRARLEMEERLQRMRGALREILVTDGGGT